MSLSLIQGAAMIRLASSSSQEANAMVCLSNGWLEWSGEVKLQTSVFGYGGYGKWCYNNETGTGIGYTWCKEALETKRPRNARGKCEFEVKVRNCATMEFWEISDLREFWCISGCLSSSSSSQIVPLFISNKFGSLLLIRIQNHKFKHNMWFLRNPSFKVLCTC